MAALIGGGSGQIRPGALCRAHRGVLFLDEAPEFPRAVLDTLRQPLERGSVTIHRAGGSARSPAGPSWSSRPTRARARPRPATPRARAARSSAAATSPGCPARCSTASTCGWTSRRSPAPPGSTARAPRVDRRSAAGSPAPGGGGRAAGRHRADGQQPGARPAAARALAVPRPSLRLAPSGRSSGARCRSAASTGCCGSPGRWPTWRGRRCPGADEVAEALGMRLQRAVA